MTKGRLTKMRVQSGETVQYFLRTGDKETHLNPLLGKKIELRFSGRIECIVCGQVTRKSFGQGMCYPCFINAPENAECIVRPELCRGHLNEGRDVEWEKKHHVQPHHVYLALSSGVKVGVTRTSQVPVRWIDQGAVKVIVLATVPYRQLAGLIEVALKKIMPDKTNWQRMLKNEINQCVSMTEQKILASGFIPDELNQYLEPDNRVETFIYPVLRYPVKVVSQHFDKSAVVSGTLTGIKGQYLIFEGGAVINIRNMSGYVVEFFVV